MSASAAPAILTRIDECADGLASLRGRIVAHQAAVAMKDVALAERPDLRSELVGPAAESERERFGLERIVGVLVEVHEDVPRQQGTYVAFHELHDGGSQDPLEIVHVATVPYRSPRTPLPPGLMVVHAALGCARHLDCTVRAG
jgi:hypothetical protein